VSRWLNTSVSKWTILNNVVVYGRTLVIANTATGVSIANPVTVYAVNTGIPQQLAVVLRKGIIAPLEVRVNQNGSPLVLITVPYTTAVNTPVTNTTFLQTPMVVGAVITWDILASDGSSDPNGIATATLNWH
jgi:hypothetical protein